jgi:hypothetical protein
MEYMKFSGIHSASTTYNLSIDNLKEILSQALVCDVNQISLESLQKVVSSDPMDRFPTVFGFDGLKVTVKAIQ